jgi:hypothetical protein
MATTKQPTLAELQSLSTGLPAYCAGMSFLLAGTTYSTTQALAIVTSFLAAETAVQQAKAAYKQTLTARDTLTVSNGVIVRELREILVLNFSNSPPVMASLGVSLRKLPKPLSAAALAVRDAKAKATRLARGTASKKEKATVAGNVTGVSITPMVVPGPSVPATAMPAPVATVTAPIPAVSVGTATATGTH